MKKTRADSVWGKLAPEQRAQLDEWYFQENLSYREMLERAQMDFAVTASLQSLAAYFQRREEPPELADHTAMPCVEAMRRIQWPAGSGRVGKTREGFTETLALHFTAMAYAIRNGADEAGQDAGAASCRSLLKLLMEDRRLVLEQETKTERLEIQRMLAAVKIKKDLPQRRSLEQWKKMIDEAGEIVKQVQENSAEIDKRANERPKK